MRLIVHLGFHKTASTHLQHLFNLNAESMAARGVWYQPQADYPAHHPAAPSLRPKWEILFAIFHSSPTFSSRK